MIFIEGNIGSGKTTIINALRKHGLDVIPEPVDEWTRTGRNILEAFYNDQTRYAYTFQSIAFRTRVKSIKGCTPHSIIERSVFTDRKVFAKTCHENGFMNEIEWGDYCDWFEWLTDEFDITPAGVIYLRADPSVSKSRIDKRGRSGENAITMDYLKTIHKRHDDWLMNDPNTLVIDVNEEFESDTVRIERIINKIKQYVDNIAGCQPTFLPQ